MHRVYRTSTSLLSASSRTARSGSGQSAQRRQTQPKKPASEKALARLRSAQERIPTKQVDWIEPAGSTAKDDVWPVMDELMHDWLYEA